MSAKGIRSLFGGKNYEYTRLGKTLGEVQNVKKSNVYVFGDDDLAEDDVVEFEMGSIRSRRDGRNHAVEDDDSPEYVERRLTDDDTLQSVSLQYGCPISELKRVNKLIRDQDFYALTSVKIPVKKYSFLVDKIQEDDKSITETSKTLKLHDSSLSNGAACLDSCDDQSLHYDSETDRTTDLSDPETQRSVIRKLSIRKKQSQSQKEARQFLRDMDKDLSNIMKNTRTDRNSLDEVISVLTHKSVNPLIMKEKPKKLDCSLKWKTAIGVLIVVAVVVPLVFVFYYLVCVRYDSKMCK